MVEIKEGPELDRAVAEAVGLIYQDNGRIVKMADWCTEEGGHGDGGHRVLRKFSTDLNATFSAAAEMGLFKEYGYCEASGQHVISKTVPVKSWGDTIAHEAAPALAICAAILKLKGNKDGD